MLTVAAAPVSPEPAVTELMRREIPNAPGLQARAIRVTYRPRQASFPHSHRGFLIAYMLHGTIESRVGKGPLRTFHAGDSWAENPGEMHLVCRNPSMRDPAEFLVVLVEQRIGSTAGRQ